MAVLTEPSLFQVPTKFFIINKTDLLLFFLRKQNRLMPHASEKSGICFAGNSRFVDADIQISIFRFAQKVKVSIYGLEFEFFLEQRAEAAGSTVFPISKRGLYL
jgi:hypothetical protein